MTDDREPSLETMRSRIYDPVLYPSQPNLIGDLRADAMRLLDLLEQAEQRLDQAIDREDGLVASNDALIERAERAEARLAKVPALVEAMKQTKAGIESGDLLTVDGLTYLAIIDALVAWDAE